MTERDPHADGRGADGSGADEPVDHEPVDHELRPPSEPPSPERRALADAIRDALTARADAPERDGPPRRAPAVPAITDGEGAAAADARGEHAPVADAPVEDAQVADAQAGRDSMADGEPSLAAVAEPARSSAADAGSGEPQRAPAGAFEAVAPGDIGPDEAPSDATADTDSDEPSDEPSEEAVATTDPAGAPDVDAEAVEGAGAEIRASTGSDAVTESNEREREPKPGPERDSKREPEPDPEPDREPQPDLDSEADATPPVSAAIAAAPEEPSSLEAAAPIDRQESPRRFISRGALAVGARAATGAIGVLVAALAIVAATVSPDPRITSTPRALTVDPVPAAQQRVCPGPLLRLGDDEGQGASTASSVGRAGSVFQASPRNPDSEALPETENTAGVAPQLLVLPPETETAADARSAPALAGSQSQAVESGDLVGLAAAECAEASGDTWLVGGSTDVGRTTLVTLSNPTTVIATVDLTIFGPSGEIAAPGSRGIVVRPGVQRIFSLAGFAPQIPAPVVRVTSRGGLVVPHLQQTTVRTLEPGGIDIVGATRPPARRVVIPGVVVGAASAITEAQGREGYADLQTTLRMLVPGVEATNATVTITPEEGQAVPEAGDSVAVEGGERGSTGFEIPLGAGEVTELPVPGLADGSYTVTIEADRPLVAGARASTIGDAGSDFTWLPAGRPLGETTLLSVAFGPGPVLHLANPGDEDRTVTVLREDDETEIDVRAGESVDAALVAGEDVTLDGTSGLLATVTYTGDGRLAAFGVTAPGPASTPVTVYR